MSLDRPGTSLERAEVTSTDPFEIRPAGASSSIPARRLDGYNPNAGDIVEVAQLGSSLVVLGASIEDTAPPHARIVDHSIAVDPSSPTFALTVARLGDPTAPATATLQIVGGTGQPGADYVDTAPVVVWDAGDSTNKAATFPLGPTPTAGRTLLARIVNATNLATPAQVVEITIQA